MQFRFHSLVILVLVVFAQVRAQASDISAVPTRLTLAPSEEIGAITVHNDDSKNVVIQAELTRWTQVGAEDKYEPTRDIIVNPAIFEIAPGGQQIVRLGLQVGEDMYEKAYRLFLQEVPAKDAAPTSAGTTTLLRIGIPIFVPPMRIANTLQWTLRPTVSGKLAVTLRNEGTVHTQISKIRLLTQKGEVMSDEDIFAYVLPGQSRRWEIDTKAALKQRQLLYLEADTDAQDVRTEVIVEPLPSTSDTQ